MKKLITAFLALGTLTSNAACLDKMIGHISEKEDEIEAMPFYTKTPEEFVIPSAVITGSYAGGALGVAVSGPGAIPAISSFAGAAASVGAAKNYLYEDINKAELYLSYGKEVIQLLKEAQAYDGEKLRSMLFNLNKFGSENNYTLTTLADAINDMNEEEEFVCEKERFTTTYGIFLKLKEATGQQDKDGIYLELK